MITTLFARPKVLLFMFFLSLISCGGGGGGGETISFRVVSTEPQNLAEGVNSNSPLSLVFNKDIFSESLDSPSSAPLFTIVDEFGDRVDGEISLEDAKTVSFTPNKNLALLTRYTATLASSITDLSGNPLSENYSWSFTTTDGSWQNEGTSRSSNVDLEYPDVAIDGEGNVFAVMTEDEGSGVYSLRWPVGNDAPELEQLEDRNSTSTTSTDARIAANESGYVVVTWLRRGTFNGVNTILPHFYIPPNDGGSFASGLTRYQINENASKVISTHFNNLSRAFVIWCDSNGIQVQRGLWSVSRHSLDGLCSAPKMVADANNHSHVIWLSTGLNGQDVATARILDEEPSTIEEEEFIDGEEGTDSYPQLASSNGPVTDKSVMAVWLKRSSNGSTYTVRASGYGSDNNWTGSSTISTASGGANVAPSAPGLAMDGRGNAIAVWLQSEDDTQIKRRVWQSTYTAGEGWGTPTQIQDDQSVCRAYDPKVAMSKNGHAIVVWGELCNNSPVLVATRYTRGAGWSDNQPLASEDFGNPFWNGKLAMNEDGRAAVVWQRVRSLGSDSTDIVVKVFR